MMLGKKQIKGVKMKFDKYVLLEQRDSFNDKKMIKDIVQVLKKTQAAVRSKYGKTYSKDIGNTMEHTVYQLDQLIEEWKNIEL